MRRREKSHINYQKIPLLPSVTSWKEVDIREYREELVSLNDTYKNQILVEPQYFLQGIEGSIKECFVRETVAKMLVEASKLLPQNYKFIVWDAWRPVEVQTTIFTRYKKEMKHLNPEIAEEDLINLVQKYVSRPSLDRKSPPPHSTGGAVDLSIVDKSGNCLDMGTLYDDFSDKASTRYFEEKIEMEEDLSDNEMIILNNRRLLFHTLTGVGFTNYPDEWWHFDYGNQFWGKVKGVSAIYGRFDFGDLYKKI